MFLRISHRLQKIQHQFLIPAFRLCHGLTTSTGQPRHHPPGGLVVQRQNGALSTHHHKVLHTGTLCVYDTTQTISPHTSGTHSRLSSRGAPWSTDPQVIGVSGGLAQDQCGFDYHKLPFYPTQSSTYIHLLPRPAN